MFEVMNGKQSLRTTNTIFSRDVLLTPKDFLISPQCDAQG